MENKIVYNDWTTALVESLIFVEDQVKFFNTRHVHPVLANVLNAENALVE